MCCKLRPSADRSRPDFVLDQAPCQIQPSAMLHVTIVDDAHGVASISGTGVYPAPFGSSASHRSMSDRRQPLDECG
jgi:hypothetical protein